MTVWTDLVKKIYNNNKHKKGYKLGHAMKAAKKSYKKTKGGKKAKRSTKKMKAGNRPEDATTAPPSMFGGKGEGDNDKTTPPPMSGGNPDKTTPPPESE
jgi:hypothetical protein